METSVTCNITASSLVDCLHSKELRLKEKSAKRRNRRHIPHSLRPTEFVEKRNGRERQRVDDMNNAYESLKDRVPFITRRTVRTSKMKILTNAISYIQHLSTLIGELDDSFGPEATTVDVSMEHVLPRNSDIETSKLIQQSETELLESRIPPILQQSAPGNYPCIDLSPTETYGHNGCVLNDRSSCNQSYQQLQYWNDSHLSENTLFEGSFKPTDLRVLFQSCDYPGELIDGHREQFTSNSPQNYNDHPTVGYHEEINGEENFKKKTSNVNNYFFKEGTTFNCYRDQSNFRQMGFI